MKIYDLRLTLERTNKLRKLFSLHVVMDIYDLIEDTGIPMRVIQDYLNCNLDNREYIESKHIKAIAGYLGMTAEQLFRQLSSCNDDCIVIGITGHRDIAIGHLSRLEEIAHTLFMSIKEKYPSSPITVMSSLAEGADQLCARAALRAGFRLAVPLSKNVDEYRNDFNQEAALEFERLCAVADDVFVVTTDQLFSPFWTRGIGYRITGMYIVEHAHILIALWNGLKKETEEGAATYETIKKAFKADKITDIWQIVTPSKNIMPDNAFSIVNLTVGDSKDTMEKAMDGHVLVEATLSAKDANE